MDEVWNPTWDATLELLGRKPERRFPDRMHDTDIISGMPLWAYTEQWFIDDEPDFGEPARQKQGIRGRLTPAGLALVATVLTTALACFLPWVDKP